MLSHEECVEIHKKNKNQLCYIEYLAKNDGRMILRNVGGVLYIFMNAEMDIEEQAQAARLCAAINTQRNAICEEEGDSEENNMC